MNKFPKLSIIERRCLLYLRELDLIDRGAVIKDFKQIGDFRSYELRDALKILYTKKLVKREGEKGNYLFRLNRYRKKEIDENINQINEEEAKFHSDWRESLLKFAKFIFIGLIFIFVFYLATKMEFNFYLKTGHSNYTNQTDFNYTNCDILLNQTLIIINEANVLFINECFNQLNDIP